MSVNFIELDTFRLIYIIVRDTILWEPNQEHSVCGRIPFRYVDLLRRDTGLTEDELLVHHCPRTPPDIMMMMMMKYINLLHCIATVIGKIMHGHRLIIINN